MDIDININVIGSVADGKSAISYLLYEFFKDLSINSSICIYDESVKVFDMEQWKNYKERFKVLFRDKNIDVNIIAHQEYKEYRANGDMICEYCGRSYYNHPLDGNKKDSDGYYYLNILCNGDRVKL